MRQIPDDQPTLYRDEDVEEKLSGLVDSIIFSSGDGQFCVFRLRPDRQNGRVNVTLNGSAPLIGQELHLRGNWVEHPRFGHQFKATGLIVESPTDILGIERFLGSGVIKGLGPVRAHKIVQKFGEETLRIIEEHPSRLAYVDGISKKLARQIAESYQEQSELREVMIWLEGHGVSGALAGRIYEQYSSFAIDMLENHPYALASEVRGIGFTTADAIASSIGYEKDDAARIAAGIDYTLVQISQNGHCCIPEKPLADKAAQILQVSSGQVLDVLREELAADRVIAEDLGQGPLLYAPQLYRAEKKTADKLLYLQRYAEPLLVAHPEKEVSKWAAKSGITLSDGQQAALCGVLEHGVFVLTGGPGTGKTTVVRGMIALLEKQGLTIQLGAPTGRAAKRLSEATGRKAMTVHRMLEAQGGESGIGFGRDEDTQLEADAIILDEVSMMDIVLMQHFLAAVPDGCHVPSVGPGSVLKDILRSEVIPSVRLTEIFRQGEGSDIVLNAHAINAGRLPTCTDTGDFRFIEIADADEVSKAIVAICAEVIPSWKLSPMTDVQVLSPMHRLACGVDNLNHMLQQALNPPGPEKKEFGNSVQTFRLGDKVMQTKNNYQKHVFNGDIGFVTKIGDDHLTVHFGEDLDVDYEKQELIELALAYAMSVHKSQGSEYPIVILPLVAGHRIMLQRNLLYTAVTRAKRLVILLGTKAALNTAVSNDRTRKRYTLLAERLNKTI